ncbi:MAG: hypothetical protein ACKO5C_05055 [Ferruginibacter sp.]
MNEDWEEIETAYSTEDFFIIDKLDIIIGEHTFKTYGDSKKNEYEDHVAYTWKAVNSKGEKCYVIIKRFNPKITTNYIFCIVYTSGIMYEYEIIYQE